MLDTGCWILDAGYWILDTGYWIFRARSLILCDRFFNLLFPLQIKLVNYELQKIRNLATGQGTNN
jgi:hypothetical protein